MWKFAGYMLGWVLGVVVGTAALWWSMWRNTPHDWTKRGP